jgi:sensor histidine kinase YesM
LQVFAKAQNPVGRIITNQNGLPSNTVYSILQDTKGYIWLGHDKGLSRYDGASFKDYAATEQQGKSVSNLMQLGDNIWCQDFSGNFYYTKNDELIKELRFKSTGSYAAAGILNKQVLASVNFDSVKSFNIATKARVAIASPANTLQAVFHDKQETYFFANNCLQKFNGSKVTVEQTFSSPLPRFTFLVKVDGVFYAFNRSKNPLVYKIFTNQLTPVLNLKPDLLIQGVNVIEDEIWVSTSTGAYCFNKAMQLKYGGKCFFGEFSVTNVLKDRESSYWFGTLNRGLIVVPDINSILLKYGGESITALSNYNGEEVLAGTSSNLIFSLNGKTNAIQTIVSNETKGEIFHLFYDSTNNTIISCANEIAFYKNGENTDRLNIAGKALAVLSKDNYGLAYSGGSMLLNRRQNKAITPNWLQKYVRLINNQLVISQGDRGRTILFDDEKQTLYIGTAKGLQLYNKTKSESILHNGKPIFASTLCLVNRELYIGTFSDGLKMYSNGSVKQMRIVSKNVHRISKEENNLWIASDVGVEKFNTVNRTVIQYSVADGLPKAEIKDILVKNGNVFLATTDGLVVFSSNKPSVNKVPPIINVNNIVVNDIEQPLSEAYNLKPTDNNIEIFFSLLTYKDNSEAKVSYRINNQNWQTLPKGVRNLQLASLAPDKYVIEVKAANEDDIAAEKSITLRFTIATPFYKKFWFIALIAGLLVFGIYVYFRQRLLFEQKQNELLAQKIELEQELHESMLSSIKSQMNPHFLFNALNTIQSYIYTNEKENASLYLGKFSELTRTILDMSNKPKVTLAEEIKALQLYVELEELRFENKLTCNFNIDKSISTETVYIPSMLIQPYIENAIKHGLMHQRNLWLLGISFVQKQNAIEVTIDDNGVGRKASAAINQQKNRKYQSFATGANQKRLDILNKGLKQSIAIQTIDKVDASGQALGTTIVLSIPLL